MKKLKFRKWFENLLLIINLVLFLILVSGIEYFIDNIILFILITLILLINTFLLYKYGDIFEK